MNPIFKWLGIGLALAAGFYLFRRLTAPASLAPVAQNAAWAAADDSAPAAAYEVIVPPIATFVRPNAGNIRLRKNDSYVPALYTLPAYGPNRNS